jgi:hypothetical protein
MGLLVGAAVVGAMGLGAGAVAACSEDFRRNISHAVVKFFQPENPTRNSKTNAAWPSPG